MQTENAFEKQEGLNQESGKKGMGCLSVLGLMLLTVLISVAVAVWFVNWYLFPKRFEPVELSVGEQQVLEQKLQRFEAFGENSAPAIADTTENSGELLPVRLVN